MRQLIIARKDLQMSPGKLAAQVAHASWAFLSQQIRNCVINEQDTQNTWVELCIDTDIYIMNGFVTFLQKLFVKLKITTN